MSGRGITDRSLFGGMASTQLIGWGTLRPPLAVEWSLYGRAAGIVRTAGAAGILGREGFGAMLGALSVAPLLLALVWEGAGGYGPAPWMLAEVALAAAEAFFLEARRC